MNYFIKLTKFLPLILLSLTPIIWFWGKSRSTLINGIDTNFPLDPLNWFFRRFYVWDGVSNAGRDFSSSTAGLFFHLIQVVPYFLGASLQQTQIVSLIFWFSLIIFGSFVFARIILPGRFLIQLLFVSLYTFNIYLFNTWENVKVSNLALVAALPLGMSIAVALKMKKISISKAAFFASLVGIILSGSGINPSYFFAFFLNLMVLFIAIIITNFNRQSIFANLKSFLVVGFIILLVNSFWILPTADFIFENISPAGSIDKLGFTNWIDSLSENTSLVNVMRLQGAWDWYTIDSLTGLPAYIPYALNYFKNLPFIAFSFLIPLLVLLSFLSIDYSKKYLYVASGLLSLIGVFLGAGTHLPSGIFYRFLIDHLPFFTIFRSPWYIFTPLVVIAFAILVSLLMFNLSKLKNLKLAISLFSAVLIIGNLIYSYPLVSGKIFRPNRKDSFYINFPSYVFESKQWLDNQGSGRIISYPDDEIEQFEWGYRGIESSLSLLTNREFLYSSLNLPDSPVSRLIKELYQSLKKGQIDKTGKIAAKLNASLIFEKKDQISLSPKLNNQLISKPMANFGPWYFYKFPQNFDHLKIYSVPALYFGYPYFLGSKLIGNLEPSQLLVDPDDSQVKSVPGAFDSIGYMILAENSQAKEMLGFTKEPSKLNNRLTSRDLSKVKFSFEVVKESFYKPFLERYSLESFGINIGNTKMVEILLDGEKKVWEIDGINDSYVFFKPLKLSKGNHEVVLNLDNKNLIMGGDFEGQGGYVKKGDGIFSIEKNESGHILSILNKGAGAPEPSVDFKIPSFDPQADYLIELKYQQIYGNNANVVIFQATHDALVKAQTERLPNYPQMNNFSFFYEPVKTDSELNVSLIAPYLKDPLGTKVFYDDVTVRKVFTNQLMFIEDSRQQAFPSVKTTYKYKSPIAYDVEVEGVTGAHILVFAENYSPKWDISFYSDSGRNLNIKPIHFSANLYANAWYIEGAPDKYTAKISNNNQNLLIVGFLISGLTIILVIINFILKFKR